MSTYLSVLFLVKRSKISSKGLCPIFMRLTISGKRLEFSIGRSIEPEKWCNDSGKLKGRSSEVRQVNNYLDLLKSRVHKIQQDFYAFAENRVIDGRELEGLEWVSSRNLENKSVNWHLTYKPVNNAPGVDNSLRN
ncbi:Arm DNA-binding domain-containing protein [Chryseobacterium sp.]|uniref:Arm DNA-binding domain-containing protein n=1 Tax=Chryseobacterium sp. TaxID=1871047 RepID=UPI00289DE5C0|nr:Arm DNA-binding domain-containing protein [Chryseobacterium sp.]